MENISLCFAGFMKFQYYHFIVISCIISTCAFMFAHHIFVEMKTSCSEGGSTKPSMLSFQSLKAAKNTSTEFETYAVWNMKLCFLTMLITPEFNQLTQVSVGSDYFAITTIRQSHQFGIMFQNLATFSSFQEPDTVSFCRGRVSKPENRWRS